MGLRGGRLEGWLSFVRGVRVRLQYKWEYLGIAI
jgi:hypothetical protein